MKLSTLTIAVLAIGLSGCGQLPQDDDANGEPRPTGECGNGTVESGEACDDGNTDDGDGCNAACQSEGSGADAGANPPPDPDPIDLGLVVLNEIVAKAADDGPDWLELHNRSDAAVDISGWSILDEGSAADEAFFFAAGTTIAAGGYLVAEKDTDFAFGLGGTDALRLHDATGALADSTSWVDGDAPAGTSWGRSPNATGPFQTLETVTRGAANPGEANPPPPPPPPTGDLVINELVADAVDDGPDWIELYNPGDADVVMTGWTLGDSGVAEAERFAFAADSVVAAREYAVLIRGETFEFGLGGADSATLYGPDGEVVDTTSWSEGDAAQGTSWGRSPNGSGPFQTLTPPTPGAENAGGAPIGRPDVVFNEIAADAGDMPDWVELYNRGDAEADISGWSFSDDGTGVDHTYIFPEGTTIAAGGFHVVERETDFPFGLGGADSVHLFDADGELVDEVEWADGEAPEGASWARFPDGTGPFATRFVSRGAANTADGPAPPADPVCGDGVVDDAAGETCDDGNREPGDGCDADCAIEPGRIVINEIVAVAADDGPNWIELYNAGGADVDLTGWSMTDSGDGPDHTYAIANGTVLTAGGFAVFEQDTEFLFGLNDADAVRLYDGDGALIDETAWDSAVAGQSWGRSEDGTGEFVQIETPTRGESNGGPQ